ncbi:MAG: hypothetical protein SGILL_003436 [Bacillariaceae sp.]
MLKDNKAPHGSDKADTAASSASKDQMKVEIPDIPIPDHPANVPPEKKTTEEKVVDEAIGNKDPPESDSKQSDNVAQQPKSTVNKNILARGVSGLPMSKTHALIGAKWGHVECDVDVDDIVYWNDPQGTRDLDFVSPFAQKEDPEQTAPTRYLTFQPDPGGWNNVRMSMEIFFVMAAATGRTLVLPPKAPLYLLGIGKENARSFASFYDISQEAFKKKVKVITMEEFFAREALDGGLLGFLSEEEKTEVKPLAELCLLNEKSPIYCDLLYKHLRKAGYQPPIGGGKQCFVFDHDVFQGQDVSDDLKERVDRFCGTERKPVYYNQTIHEPQLIHWDASAPDGDGVTGFRLLNHFYSFLFFTDPVVDNFYKRFVRDFLHYKDSLYCAAGKIVHALNAEGKEWSTLHVRRGDLQYKQVKIPAEEWYENLKEVWKEGEMLFIATDERNKTFFDPIKKHHDVRFLDDYWDTAKLSDLDPYFLGMVDTIVASHGRTFSGTWFSTFTGFINRMRGYLGFSMMDSWYGWLPRKEAVREYKYPIGNYGAREWPIGWVAIDGDEVIEHEGEPVIEQEENVDSVKSSNHEKRKISETIRLTVAFRPSFKPPPQIELEELDTDEDFAKKDLSRGLAGRPNEDTPALKGASRGTIQCDRNVDSLAYWNDPQGDSDESFVSPFVPKGDDEKYITFTIDRGGWNNVRMSMEIIFVVAAATGRTLVLPPKEPLYRLAADKENKQRGFADFYPLDTPEFAKRVKTITTEEFIKREGGPEGRVPIPAESRENVANSAEFCDKRKKSKHFCGHIKEYLDNAGTVPDARAQDYCIVFDKDLYEGQPKTDDIESNIASFCGSRKRYIWTKELNDEVLIHFRAGDKAWRLLAHFYNMIHFTDPAIANYYKRFVRDFLHYNDQIFCAAGKIVKALQAEAKERGFELDSEGGGGYSAMHIRRGDFQYKKVKLPAEEWYQNTKEIWKPNEIIFIATDERDKSFFDPIAEHHDIRFLDDYWDLASLGELDPNYFGMIDTIVSSRARAFAGTWFSTFSGFINRMRGHHGMTMMDSWYSFLERKSKMHSWDKMDSFAYAYEWPDGWIGIDGDVLPDRSIF